MKRILIVDNDPSILDVMEEILIYEGFEVQSYTDTENIFGCIESCKPDLVLMDYILDGINGGELCAQIKKDPSTSNLPVILMSAYSKVLLSLGNYGCDEFIAKPFDIQELVSKICFHTQQKATSTIN
jgi:DNA-binding response OmpR family regulator